MNKCITWLIIKKSNRLKLYSQNVYLILYYISYTIGKFFLSINSLNCASKVFRNMKHINNVLIEFYFTLSTRCTNLLFSSFYNYLPNI